MSWQARTCRDCGRAFEGRPGTLVCRDCREARIARIDQVRAAARHRSLARKKARGGTTGCFRVRSTYCSCPISWGSCETQEEAFLEAGWILAAFPETSRVAVEEVVRYEISRDGLESCSADSAGAGSVAARALSAVLEARLGPRGPTRPVAAFAQSRLAREAAA